jgi:hypothetical protein
LKNFPEIKEKLDDFLEKNKQIDTEKKFKSYLGYLPS